LSDPYAAFSSTVGDHDPYAAFSSAPAKPQLNAIQTINGAVDNVLRGTGIGDELAGGWRALAETILGHPTSLASGMAGERAEEDQFKAAHPVAAGAAQGLGMGATMLAPGGAAMQAAANAGRGVNMARGAATAAGMGAEYALADRGTPQERMAAALRASANPVNLALGAVGGALAPSLGKAPLPPGMSVDDLRAAKNAAYQGVDQTGAAYHPSAFGSMVDGIAADLTGASLSPTRHPLATSMLTDLQKMKGQAPTLTQMDQLRQVINRDVAGSSDPAEQFFGKKMVNGIDSFVNGAGPADMVSGSAPGAADAIQNARDLNTRYRKVQDVTDRMDSADLRASSTYSGGNYVNALRQNLRPLIDPKSPQRMGNLTPDELVALAGVVRGTPAQNAVRVAGKVLDPRGLIGGVIAGPAALGSHGASLLAAPLGMMATEGGKRLSQKAVDDLLQLMSAGGTAGAPVTNTANRLPPELVARLLREQGALAGSSATNAFQGERSAYR
jgi:hypothetical protein